MGWKFQKLPKARQAVKPIQTLNPWGVRHLMVVPFLQPNLNTDRFHSSQLQPKPTMKATIDRQSIRILALAWGIRNWHTNRFRARLWFALADKYQEVAK